MPAGLRIWNPDAIDPSEAVIDITQRCLNILGTIETGMWFSINSWNHPPSYYDSTAYKSDDIFTWRSITVPEFAYGKPFYNISLNEYKYISNAIATNNAAYQWWTSRGLNPLQLATSEGIRYYNNGQVIHFDSGPSGNNFGAARGFCEPDVIISGTTLSYRYRSEWRDNILGDDSWTVMGAHKITYGVV